MTIHEVPIKGNIFGKWIAARYVLAVLGFIGLAIIYGLKVNLSVAMVAMLNHTAINSSSSTPLFMENSTVCLDLEDEIDHQEGGEFIWSEPLQGTILSCYFWGYFISQMPGGRIAELYSAKMVMLFAVLINIVCTLLTPVLTKTHYIALIILRILEGIGGGVTFPAMHSMLVHWAPAQERGVMSAIIYTGTGFGTAMSILLAGVLAANFGWEFVFYTMGGLSIIWVILWIWLIQDSPNKQPYISQEERDFVNQASGHKKETGNESKDFPWGKVLSSLPFWAIVIAHMCSNWGWYMFLIEIPFYLKQVLRFRVEKNAVFSALPYFIMLVTNVLLSRFLDLLQTKEIISTTFSRKFATLISSLVPLTCVLALCFIGCLHTLAVIIMTVGIVSMGAMFFGFLSNHIDIAPNYAGTLMAITNTFATIPGIIVPLFVGFITEGNQTIDAWRTIFYVTAGLFSVEAIVYTIFGTGKQQPWNDHEIRDEENPLK